MIFSIKTQSKWFPSDEGPFCNTAESSFSQLSSVQLLSRVWLFKTPWIARQASLSITNSWSLLRLMSIESVMPFNHLMLCRPFLLLPLIPPSIRVFSSESTLHMRWPKYWSFSFSIISQLRASLISLSFSELLPYSWEKDRTLFKCRAANLLSWAISGPLILDLLDEGDRYNVTTYALNQWATGSKQLVHCTF